MASSMFYFLQKCYHFLFQRYRLEHYTVSSNWLALGTVVVFTVLSLSRSVALFRGVCRDTHWSLQPGVRTPSKIKHVLCVCRLPRPSGPLPRIPSHRQGSHSSLRPRRPACQRVCGQRVVQIPQQLPSATQVCIQSFFRHKCPLISS